MNGQPQPPTEAHKLRYDAYAHHRRRVEDLYYRHDTTLERLIIGGAAGALVLSITFLHSIAPNPVPGSVGWIRVSWIALLVSLVFGFLKHLLIRPAIDQDIHSLDRAWRAYTQTGEDFTLGPFPNKWDTSVGRCGLVAALGLLVGIIALTVFAWLNLPR